MGQGQSKCVDFLKVKELEKKIQELRDGALRKIDDSHRKHVKGGGSCINDDRLQLFLHQIKNRMLLVAVVGEGSCGKSTLINAFLRDKILPSGIGRVTGFRIFIGHDPNVHETPCESSTGYCDQCPYLVRGIGKDDVLCCGVKNIKSKIAEKNKKDKNQKDPLVLYTYIPVFDSLSSSTHFVPYFVDSPGVEVINDDVESYYSILSAMIYVENYQRLFQNEENIKKELHCKPEDASLFFAVSHFDKYYTSHADEQNPDKEETKAKVECNMELVKHEEVFPVCGDWALHALLALKYKERDEISCDVVEEAYRKAQLTGGRSADKTSFVLEVSAFKELEEKLKNSIDETNFQEWNNIICKQCQALLEGPIKAGDIVLQIIESRINEISENVQEIKVKIETLENLEEGVERYVSEELEQDLQQLSFSFFTRRLSPIIEESMRTFRISCRSSVNNNYTFGQYLRDWDVFSKGDLNAVIKQELNNETERCVEVLGSRLREKYNMLIRHILSHDPQSTTFTAEAETQEVDSCSIREPSEGIMGSFQLETAKKKLLNYVFGTFSALASLAGIGIGLLSIPVGILAPPVAIVAPLAVGSSLALTGFSAFLYCLKKAGNTTNLDITLSEEDVRTLCDRLNSEIVTNSASIRIELEKAVKNTLRGYNVSLKDAYNSEWGSKLNQKLGEAQTSLAIISEEKNQLKQALDELKDYNESLKRFSEGN